MRIVRLLLFWLLVTVLTVIVVGSLVRSRLALDQELGRVDYAFFALYALIGTFLVVMVTAGVVQVVRHWRNPPVPIEQLQVRHYLAQTDSAPVFQVVSTTTEGWRIESPDNYHFYPVGPPGPAEFDEVRSSGFSNTEDGAAFAAIHILHRANPTANAGWERIYEDQMLGPGSVELQRQGEQLLTYPEAEQLAAVGPHRFVYVGWEVLNYTGLRADLRLVGLNVLNDRTLKFVVRVTMLWSEEDWKMDFYNRSKLTSVEVTDFGSLDVDYRHALASTGEMSSDKPE